MYVWDQSSYPRTILLACCNSQGGSRPGGQLKMPDLQASGQFENPGLRHGGTTARPDDPSSQEGGRSTNLVRFCWFVSRNIEQTQGENTLPTRSYQVICTYLIMPEIFSLVNCLNGRQCCTLLVIYNQQVMNLITYNFCNFIKVLACTHTHHKQINCSSYRASNWMIHTVLHNFFCCLCLLTEVCCVVEAVRAGWYCCTHEIYTLNWAGCMLDS